MLNLKSQLRRKLLAFSFSHTDESFYLRELARKLDVDPTNLSRELHALVQQGIFTDEKRGNQKYFRCNTKHPFFYELKSIVTKTVGVIGSLKEAFAKLPLVHLALLYGSFAKGEEDSASDIDVILVGKIRPEAIANIVSALEKRLGREINITTYTHEEFSRKRKDNDSFLGNVLRGPHELLIGHL